MRTGSIYALAVLGLTILPTISRADGQDPTFNGMSKLLHCSIQTTMLCEAASCFPIRGTVLGTSNFWISFVYMRVSSQKPSMAMPETLGVGMTVHEVSPAALNEALHVRFSYENSSGEANGILVYVPQGGSYSIQMGTSIPLKKQVYGLNIDRILAGGPCTIERE